MDIKKEIWGHTSEGDVYLYTLRNDAIEVKLTNFGGILVSINVPDGKGNVADVVLGYDTLEEYVNDNYYFGAIVGRYANRIANGEFELNGKKYNLAINNGGNHLHGGIKGFNKALWKSKETENGIELSYLSIDGEEGYPGNLETKVAYTLNNNSVRIDYQAITDSPTIINLTSHSYFNLAGNETGDILNHKLMINAEKFTPINGNMIPGGEIKNVKETPMDFSEYKSIGEDIKSEYEQIKIANGYDHNWVLNKKENELALAAQVFEPQTERSMKVYTTHPGIQFYSVNSLDIKGKNDKRYGNNHAFCLETQHFPDSPNLPDFPSTVLKPGEEYKHTTIYEFY